MGVLIGIFITGHFLTELLLQLLSYWSLLGFNVCNNFIVANGNKLLKQYTQIQYISEPEFFVISNGLYQNLFKKLILYMKLMSKLIIYMKRMSKTTKKY